MGFMQKGGGAFVRDGFPLKIEALQKKRSRGGGGGEEKGEEGEGGRRRREGRGGEGTVGDIHSIPISPCF